MTSVKFDSYETKSTQRVELPFIWIAVSKRWNGYMVTHTVLLPTTYVGRAWHSWQAPNKESLPELTEFSLLLTDSVCCQCHIWVMSLQNATTKWSLAHGLHLWPYRHATEMECSQDLYLTFNCKFITDYYYYYYYYCYYYYYYCCLFGSSEVQILSTLNVSDKNSQVSHRRHVCNVDSEHSISYRICRYGYVLSPYQIPHA
jgi:hypothetical protein